MVFTRKKDEAKARAAGSTFDKAAYDLKEKQATAMNEI
jgi:hypothetical protein